MAKKPVNKLIRNQGAGYPKMEAMRDSEREQELRRELNEIPPAGGSATRLGAGSSTPRPHPAAPVPRSAEGSVDSAEIKRRYEAKLRKLQELEARAATYREREEALPRRLRFDIAELRTEVEELRLWGHRAHLKGIREAMGNS